MHVPKDGIMDMHKKWHRQDTLIRLISRLPTLPSGYGDCFRIKS